MSFDSLLVSTHPYFTSLTIRLHTLYLHSFPRFYADVCSTPYHPSPFHSPSFLSRFSHTLTSLLTLPYHSSIPLHLTSVSPYDYYTSVQLSSLCLTSKSYSLFPHHLTLIHLVHTISIPLPSTSFLPFPQQVSFYSFYVFYSQSPLSTSSFFAFRHSFVLYLLLPLITPTAMPSTILHMPSAFINSCCTSLSL